IPLRARVRRSRDLVRGGRGVRARGLPLPSLVAGAPVAHRRREHRPLAGKALPRLLDPGRRFGRLHDRRRPYRRSTCYFVTLKKPNICDSWTEQSYFHLPGLRVTITVFLPWNAVPVSVFSNFPPGLRAI